MTCTLHIIIWKTLLCSFAPPRIWQIPLYCYNSDDFTPPIFLNCPIHPPPPPPLIQNPLACMHMHVLNLFQKISSASNLCFIHCI